MRASTLRCLWRCYEISHGISFTTGLSRQCETSPRRDFLEPNSGPRVPKIRSLSNLYWCATHSVCRKQVWAVATRVSHATCADPYPCVCLARTPWWSCPKNTHTPPHFTTYYSITLILTLLLSTYTTATRWLTSVLSSLARRDNAIGTIGWNFRLCERSKNSGELNSDSSNGYK